MALFRLEWTLSHGAASGKEGLWLALDDRVVQFVDWNDILRQVGDTWTERPASGGPSRQELLPSDVFLQLGRVRAFALEFLEVISDEASAIFGIPSRPDRLPLPALVSKEIEIQSNLAGRGRFGRIHTAFHPQLAVDENDPRQCTAAYGAALLEWFQLLVGVLESNAYFNPHPPRERENIHVAVVHRDRPLSLGTGLLSFATGLTLHNRRWGTMRRRGAVIRH